ncbi:MAG: recombinase family protein [Candidatus Marinimicrobia bacterium]|nr:recombinase family protein [Candidatus Neomarinimicrobiota bacterium]
MLIGYAHVSTTEQNLDLQLDALNQAGCEQIYQDVVSGAKTQRLGLDDALNHLRKEDTLVVWKLDRLGRSLSHLIKVVTSLDDRGIYFKSLQESIDTGSFSGKLIFHFFGALAEFERDIIRERTKAGLEAARARGHIGGRPRLLTNDKVEMARKLLSNRDTTADEVPAAMEVPISIIRVANFLPPIAICAWSPLSRNFGIAPAEPPTRLVPRA